MNFQTKGLDKARARKLIGHPNTIFAILIPEGVKEFKHRGSLEITVNGVNIVIQIMSGLICDIETRLVYQKARLP